MLVDWKNQYCQNDYTIQGNLQIQCNTYQITNGIFFAELELKISIFKMHGDSRFQIAKAIFKKKNRAGGPGFLTSDCIIEQ